MNLTMHVVPTIWESLVGQPVSTCQKHLLGLKLADTSTSVHNTLPIDLLIEADAYCSLAFGLVHQECEEPTAVHMKLRWVLSGLSHSASPYLRTTNLITHALPM